MSIEKKKYRTTLELDSDTAKILKELAIKDDRSIASFVRKIITNYIESVSVDLEYDSIDEPVHTPEYAKFDRQNASNTKQEANNGSDMNFAKNTPKIKNDFI